MSRPLNEHPKGCGCAWHEFLAMEQALVGSRDRDADLAISVKPPQPPLAGKARRAAEKEARAIKHVALVREQKTRAARRKRRGERRRSLPQRSATAVVISSMTPDATGHFWVWAAPRTEAKQ